MRGVSFAHHGRAPLLEDFALAVDAGELVLLEGASGAGKSTVLRLATGLIPRVQGGRLAGSVRVAGRDPATLEPSVVPRSVGFVPQDPESSFVARTVAAELAGVLSNVGEPQRTHRALTEEVLEELEIAHLARREVATLSGGEAGRAALAASLVARPDLLVLDEPTAQLDAVRAEALAGTLRALTAGGLAVLVAAHAPHPFTHRTRAFTLCRRDHSPRPRPLPSPRGGVPLLAAEGLEGSHPGARSLGPLELHLAPGEVVALVGENGSGKSTLLHLLAGLLGPTAGTIRLLGDDPRSLPARHLAARLGFAFQHPAWHITQDQVAAEVGRTGARMLHVLGLTPLARAHPWDLSGGERQRLAVATALAHAPPVALLDEPTRGLDDASLARLAGLLAQRVELGQATLVGTHHPGLVALAHRVLRLEDGRLRAVAPERLEVPA